MIDKLPSLQNRYHSAKPPKSASIYSNKSNSSGSSSSSSNSSGSAGSSSRSRTNNSRLIKSSMLLKSSDIADEKVFIFNFIQYLIDQTFFVVVSLF